MSDTIREFNYGGGAVLGSLAYDFNYPRLYPEYTFEQPEREAPPAVRERENTRVKPRTRGRQSFAPFALIGYACAAVMLLFLLMAHVQLATISDETVAIQSRLDELRVEEVRLRISYESAFNLAEIEEYAINVLGMQKPRSEQVLYVDGAASDRAVIHTAPVSEDGFFDRIIDLISSLGEYFRR